ncbi:hypothetical protein [Sphingomonas oligophenolica]|uniref:hypothetical protein n=1 Tax=Sphingomonas oligophenolica TaxID=301154 RepID=UPI0031F4F465
MIEKDGWSFRRFVESCVPETMLAYANGKQAEIDQLGGGKGQMRIETALALETDDPVREIAEIFLGQRDAKVIDIAAFSTRFGIDIPDTELSGQTGIMRLQPKPSDGCTVLLRMAGGNVLKFRGDLFRAPQFEENPTRGLMLVRTPAFDLTFDAVLNPTGVGANLSFSLDTDRFAEAKLSAEAWSDVCTLIAEVGELGTTLEIQTDNVPIPITSTTVGRDDQPQEQRDQFRFLARVSRDAGAVLRYSGWPEWEMTATAIFRERWKIVVLNAMIFAPATISTMVLPPEGAERPSDIWPDRMLYIDRLELGEMALAHAAIMNLSGDTDSGLCEAKFASLFRTERIDGSVDAFWAFADRARNLAGIDSYYVAARTEPDGSPELLLSG